MNNYTQNFEDGSIIEKLTSYNKKIDEIRSNQCNALKIFKEVQKGDLTTISSTFINNGILDSNRKEHVRDQYIFYERLVYGDLELAKEYKDNLPKYIFLKQKKVAERLGREASSSYLFGIKGKGIYGILNDPYLPSAIQPQISRSGEYKWQDKSAEEIYKDIITLFLKLIDQSAGVININTPLALLLSPEKSVSLGLYAGNMNVISMVKKNFANISIITLSELSSPTAGETMMLIAKEVAGQSTAVLGFGEKIKVGQVIPRLSYFEQEWKSSTYGGIVLQPSAFATMQGI